MKLTKGMFKMLCKRSGMPVLEAGSVLQQLVHKALQDFERWQVF